MIALHRLVLLALTHGMPAVCKQSLLSPLFKKGDPAICDNYRGIQLISMLRKVISFPLCRRLTAWAEGQPEEAGAEASSDQPSATTAQPQPQLLECQCGFRPQRGCADQLFSLRHCQLAAL